MSGEVAVIAARYEFEPSRVTMYSLGCVFNQSSTVFVSRPFNKASGLFVRKSQTMVP